MPELGTDIQTVEQLQHAIAKALHNYQLLVDRADQLTKDILLTQETVDALKQFTKIAERYQTEPHASPKDWIAQLQSEQKPHENTAVTPELILEANSHETIDCLSNHDSVTADQLERQYQQHHASCQLMEQHCEQSQHYLQLLRFQVQQMRESVSALLSQAIENPLHVETILTLQERALKTHSAN